MKHLVSVIMPVFNAEKYVGQAIESVLQQSYENFEFLICDDGSTDDSRQVVQSFTDPRIVFWENKINIGSLKARNAMFEKAKGGYIAFQDADDFSHPDRFEKQIAFLEKNTEYAMCGTWVNYFDAKLKFLKRVEKPVEYEDIISEMANSIPVVFPSIMVRAMNLFKSMHFRDYFFDKGNYDYDWMFRIAESYFIANLPEVLYNMRLLIDSNSRRPGNPYKIIGHKIVRFLAEERALKGADSLMTGHYKAIDDYARAELLSYRKDKSLLYRQKAEALFSFRAFKSAKKEIIRAIGVEPWKIINYRTLFYMIRKSIFVNKKATNGTK